MEASGLRENQVAQIRGYAEQDLHNKANPKDPSNRRVSLIVRYMDSPVKISFGSLEGQIKQTESHPVINPAGLPQPAAAK
jgi:chemotaxis protein MotB